MDFQQLVIDLSARGWGGSRIAREIGVTPSYISNLRTGRNKEPTYTIGRALVDLERRTRPRGYPRKWQ